MRVREFGYYPKNTVAEERPESGGIHPYHEILFIQKGEFLLESLGERYNTEGPCLFLFSLNTPHSLTANSKDLKYLYLELELNEGEEFPPLQKIMKWNAMQGHACAAIPEIQLLFRSMDLLWELLLAVDLFAPAIHQQIVILEIKKALLLIQHMMERDLKKLRGDKSDEAGIFTIAESLTRYLETNYMQTIQVETLAKLFHLSGPHLIRLFKQQHGITPSQYLDQLRLHAAKSYLLNTDYPIQKIAKLCSFDSIHYFSAFFRKHYGASPSKWKIEQGGK